jgi:hypothetical protein
MIDRQSYEYSLTLVKQCDCPIEIVSPVRKISMQPAWPLDMEHPLEKACLPACR